MSDIPLDRLRAEHAALLKERNLGPWRPPTVHLRGKVAPDALCGIGGGVISASDTDMATCVGCLQQFINDAQVADEFRSRRAADEFRSRRAGDDHREAVYFAKIIASIASMSKAALRGRRSRAVRDLRDAIDIATEAAKRRCRRGAPTAPPTST